MRYPDLAQRVSDHPAGTVEHQCPARMAALIDS
jgi:hypothetical protein